MIFKSMTTLLLLFSGLSVMLLTAAALPGGGHSAILATVDGEAVTLGDVLHESGAGEAAAVRAYGAGELPAHLEKLRKEAVDRVIDRKLLIREFKRLKLELPQQYVENLLDELAVNFGCKTRSELARKARAAGTSLDELREKASERIMADMVVGREFYAAINPTPREMNEYFLAHEKEFSIPDQLNIGLLLLTPGTAEETVTSLAARLQKNPETFSEAVNAFSSGPNREQGGTVGFIERSGLRSEFAAELPAAGPLTVGRIYGPVKTAEGIYFFKILEFKPGTKATYESAREVIRERLEKAARSEAVKNLSQRLRAHASIRYYFSPADGSPSENTASPTVPSADIAQQNSLAAADGAPAPSVSETAATDSQTIIPAVTPVKKTEKKVMVTLKTNHGDIQLELYPEAAPKTVANFLEYVKSGFYNGTLFHRVIDNFMIQGGGFDQKFHQKATREPIQNEADNRLSNELGTIAMARTSDPHSATAQFFINVANNDFLDFRSPSPQFYGYCVFGKVVAGMDVVNKIRAVKTGGRGGHQDVPKEDVVILEAIAD